MSDNFPLLPLQRIASGVIEARRILKVTGNDGELAQASDASDKLIAISGIRGAASGAAFEAHFAGLVPVEYGGVVAQGDPLTADADGKAIVATVGDYVVGRATEEGTAGTIGSMMMGAANDRVTDGDAFMTHLTSTKTQRHIPLADFRLVAGTPLAAFADGASATPGYAVDDSEAPAIRWNNHATPTAVYASVPLPPDLDDAEDVVVKVLASKTGATIGDAVTFTLTAFMLTVGALRDADANAGGATGAMTGNAASKTVQAVSRTIAAADVPAAPGSLTLSMKPTDGTLGTDDVSVHSVWLEYTPKLLTA
jgi:hypothetical protein